MSSMESVEDDDDMIDEESRLNEECKTRSYALTKFFIDVFMCLASLKLVQNLLIFDNPFKPTGNPSGNPIKRVDILKRFLSITTHIFMAITVLKSCLVAVLLTQQGLILNTWNPLVRANATRTIKCALKEDIYIEKEYLANHQKLQLVNDALAYMGYSTTSIYGANLIMMFLLGSMPLLFYYYGIIFIKMNQVRVDALSFLVDHLDERLRIRRSIIGVIGVVLKSIKHYGDNIELKKEEYHKINHPPTKFEYRQQRIRNCIGSRVANHSSLSYMRILFDVNLPDKIRPVNLSSGFLKQILFYDLFFYRTFIITSGLSILVFLTIVVLWEVLIRTLYRIDQIHCLTWNPNAVLIRGNINLSPLNSTQDFKAYQAYDGTTMSLAYLLFFIELKKFLTPGTVLAQMELGATAMVSFLIFGFYHALQAHILISKRVWFNQIERQIEECTRELTAYNEVKIFNIQNKKREMELLRKLTITYLNYELFRIQHSSYRLVADFLIVQNIVIMGGTWITVYIVGRTIKNSYKVISLIIATLTFFYNYLYLLHGSLWTSKFKKLMRKITKLVAITARNSLCMTHIVDLWRRQILSDKDVSKILGLKCFGVNLTYERFISIHGYFFALWFVLLTDNNSLR